MLSSMGFQVNLATSEVPMSELKSVLKISLEVLVHLEQRASTAEECLRRILSIILRVRHPSFRFHVAGVAVRASLSSSVISSLSPLRICSVDSE